MSTPSIVANISAITLVTIGFISVFAAPEAFATFAGQVEAGVNATGAGDSGFSITGEGGIVSQVINTMLFAVGVLSVVMLIWGGLRYILSGGNSTSVTAAKNTILYAIVGLIIALFAWAIVNFVVEAATGGVSGGGTNV